MISFLDACGIKDSLRLNIEGPGVRESDAPVLPQPFAVIGRDSRTDLLLDDPRVSRRQAYLQAVGGWLFWVDLESRTGTRTEAGPRKSGWLAGRGFLDIGPYRIRQSVVEASSGEHAPDEPPRDTPLAAQAFGREPLPEVALEFLNSPSQSMVWPMRRVMSFIGSAKGCKFRLTDPSVSAFHVSLLRTPTGLWVVDLRGGHSITVNAVPVRSSPLADGDVLGIGRYRIRLQCRDRGWGIADRTTDLVRRGKDRAISRRDPIGLPQRSLPDQSAGPVVSHPGPGNRTASTPFFPVPVVAPSSGLEVVSLDAVPSGKFSQAELTESVLGPLVSQFSLMQQQMFDQFQQAMGMLVQMFGTMHREQMDVIREELDRLHQLAQELQELKDELAKPSQQPSSPPTRLAGAPARADRERRHNAELATSAAVPPDPAITPDRREPIGAETLLTPPRSTPLTAEPPDQPQPGLTPPGSSGNGGAPRPDQDAVAWIHQRILAIQRERETRWQKILKLFAGVS